MTERAFQVRTSIAAVDVYISDNDGEWRTPLPRGELLGFDGDSGYVLMYGGMIARFRLEHLRVAPVDEAGQAFPPRSPAEASRAQSEYLDTLEQSRPRRKAKAA